MFLFSNKTMSGKSQTNNKTQKGGNTKEQVKTYTNKYFPDLILQKVNGKDVVVGVRAKDNK